MKNSYKKPVNFDKNLPEFSVFENVESPEYDPPKIETLRNVRISTSSIIFNYFKIFAPSCISNENYIKYQKNYKFFLKFIFPKFNFSKKRFIMITDEWTGNYYHWHLFSLTKLFFLKEKNLIKDSLFFLPNKYKTYKFALPSLKFFDIKDEQIVFLPRKSNIKVKEIPFVHKEHHDKIYIRKLQEFLIRNIAKTDIDFGDKIYISRQKMAIRFVENEDELVEFLKKYGFKKVIMENYSYNEQMSIANKAKHIIAPHGAGVTNILFAEQNSSILEFSTKPEISKPVTDYYKLASILDLRYFYQECEMGKSSRVMDWMSASMVVDLNKLEKNIKLMLNLEH